MIKQSLIMLSDPTERGPSICVLIRWKNYIYRCCIFDYFLQSSFYNILLCRKKLLLVWVRTKFNVFWQFVEYLFSAWWLGNLINNSKWWLSKFGWFRLHVRLHGWSVCADVFKIKTEYNSSKYIKWNYSPNSGCFESFTEGFPKF